MEQIRSAALAYYDTSSEELKQTVSNFFESLTHRKDEKVSVDDVVEFFKQRGYETEKPGFFEDLGKDLLDFEDTLVVYYVLKTSWPCCQGCEAFLKGLYFTCIPCFEKSDSTYDICTNCFGEGKNQNTHKHKVFMDSHTLLRSKSNTIRSKALTNKGDTSESDPPPQHSRREHSHGSHSHSRGSYKDLKHVCFESFEKELIKEKFNPNDTHILLGDTNVNVNCVFA